MTKLYFTKLETVVGEPIWYAPCYEDSYMPNGTILANLSNYALMKLSDILKSKFPSVVFSGRQSKNLLIKNLMPPTLSTYINDFIFRFDDTADQDFFTVWSSDGIDI
jgi:hypothetical protein